MPKPITDVATSAEKDLQAMIEETGRTIDKLGRASDRILEVAMKALDRLDETKLQVRDLRDLGYFFAVVNDKRQLNMEQKAAFEGTTEHTQAAIGKQLEGIAALKEELDRRKAAQDVLEGKTIDVTEVEDADQGPVAREEQGGDVSARQAPVHGSRQPFPPQRRARPPHVPNSHVRPRGPRI